MSQTTTTAPSINEINAALLAQYNAAQKAKGTDGAVSSGTGSFASTLSAVEKTELPPPTPLVGAKTAATAPVASQSGAATTEASDETAAIVDGDKQVTKEEVLQEEIDSCDELKISRSSRMACAEKATEVQDSNLDFDDVIDFINPLQHIPIIGSIYRAVTGDAIKPEVQVAGSIAFGLATGSVLASAATGIASAMYEENTGTEPTVQIADALFGGDSVNIPDPMTEKKVVLADAGTVDPSRTVASNKAATTSHSATATSAAGAAAANTGKAATLSNKTTASTAGRTDLSTQALAQTGGLRMGNTIYTSPLMRNAGKATTPNKTVTATAVSSSASKQAVAATETTASQTVSNTASTTTEQPSLGTMMQEQASARASGQQLPPELVHDMMLMALDKYKMAAATGASQTGVSVQ